MNTRKAPLSFGDFLRSYRLGEEMTQAELAKLLGISKSRVCDLEKDRFNVSIKLAKEIAEALDVPPEWLVKLTLQHQLKQSEVNLKVS